MLKQDEDTVRAVRASLVISSFSVAIQELVFNSLDAGASKVELSVDFENFAAEVRDNGHGIQVEGLQQLGVSQREYWPWSS
jgi:DNA mismatch repair protein MLH3